MHLLFPHTFNDFVKKKSAYLETKTTVFAIQLYAASLCARHRLLCKTENVWATTGKAILIRESSVINGAETEQVVTKWDMKGCFSSHYYTN